jgi:hypothetical protein
VTLLGDSFACIVEAPTLAATTAVHSSAGPNVTPRLPRKRPLLIPSSWSSAPGPPTRPKKF